jgi:hypothetical protein
VDGDLRDPGGGGLTYTHRLLLLHILFRVVFISLICAIGGCVGCLVRRTDPRGLAAGCHRADGGNVSMLVSVAHLTLVPRLRGVGRRRRGPVSVFMAAPCRNVVATCVNLLHPTSLYMVFP